MTLLPPIPTSDALRLLVIHYGEPHRHYHNTEHFIKVMRAWKMHAENSSWVHAIEAGVALAYHDSVYDPRSKVNEESSAALAMIDAATYGCDLGLVDNAILWTKHHDEDFDASPDVKLIMDIDIADLGGSAQQFDRNFIGVRMEYAHVPGPEFMEAQRAFLERMLSRRSIYRTAHYAYLERSAQENLRRALSDPYLEEVATRHG